MVSIHIEPPKHDVFMKGLRTNKYTFSIDWRAAHSLVSNGHLGKKEKYILWILTFITWGLLLGGVYIAIYQHSWSAALCFITGLVIAYINAKTSLRRVTHAVENLEIYTLLLTRKEIAIFDNQEVEVSIK